MTTGSAERPEGEGGGGPDAALLTAGDPPAAAIVAADAAGPFVLVGDHAGAAIPHRLDSLGVGAADLARHIAIDIGVAHLGEQLAAMLAAPFIAQRYSRLVIDCNRHTAAADSIPEVSDGTVIPGNRAISAAERDARIAAIHAPYQAAIARCLATRRERALPTVLVALHSFTPVMRGIARPWEFGVLHDAGDDRFAQALLTELRALRGRTIGDNEPYSMDTIDYTIPRHAYANDLPYAEIEVRQDLLVDDQGVAAVAAVLARVLTAALARMERGGA